MMVPQGRFVRPAEPHELVPEDYFAEIKVENFFSSEAPLEIDLGCGLEPPRGHEGDGGNALFPIEGSRPGTSSRARPPAHTAGLLGDLVDRDFPCRRSARKRQGAPGDENEQTKALATVAMEYSAVEGRKELGRIVKFYAFAGGDPEDKRLLSVDLLYDEVRAATTYYIPNLCLNCHGGSSGSVLGEKPTTIDKGAYFLPFDEASLRNVNPDKFNEDICVPRSKVPEMIRKVDAIADKYQIPIVNFGHAGDGNIHVNIMVNKKVAGDTLKAEGAIKDVFKAALELGGTMSGEHGVGIAKAPYIPLEITPIAADYMKAIKRSLDPNNILNPGKIFLDEENYAALDF